MFIDMFQTIKLHAQLQKLVIHHSILAATFPVYIINGTVQQTRCHDNRPLYVILSSDIETQQALSQVTQERPVWNEHFRIALCCISCGMSFVSGECWSENHVMRKFNRTSGITLVLSFHGDACAKAWFLWLGRAVNLSASPARRNRS
jgi:hypothetical protein